MKKLLVLVLGGMLALVGQLPTAAQSKKTQKLIDELSKAKDPADRVAAAEKLGELANVQIIEARASLPALKIALEKDVDPNVRRAALQAIGQIQPDLKDYLPLAIETLKRDKDAIVRVAIVAALADLGPMAKETLPLLAEIQKTSLETLKDKDPQGLRRSILVALGRIDPDQKKYVPILVEALKNDPEIGVRQTAVQVLGQMNPRPKEVLPVLVEVHKEALLKKPAPPPKTKEPPPPDQTPNFRRALIQTIGQFDPEPKNFVPVLIESVKSERDLGVVLFVVGTLNQIGPPAKEAVPALLDYQKNMLASLRKADPKGLQRDPDPAGIRRTILETVGKLDPDPKNYLPILLEALKGDRAFGVRQAAVKALGDLGPEAKSALPNLLALQKSLKATKGPSDQDKMLLKELDAALAKVQGK